jgi:hypothetical protein
MISRKLGHLAENIRQRSAADDVFCPTELARIAEAIRALLPTLEAMESRPIPPALRVIEGGHA